MKYHLSAYDKEGHKQEYSFSFTDCVMTRFEEMSQDDRFRKIMITGKDGLLAYLDKDALEI